MIVLFTLVSNRQHHDFRRADNFKKCDIPGVSERGDQFPLSRVLRCFAKAEGGDGKPGLRCRSDRVNRGLSAVMIFACLATLEQEVKQAFEIGFGRRRQLGDNAYRASFLRLASSLV